MSMKMRTAVSMVGASIAYVLLVLPMGRVRAQAPSVPAPPALAVPAMPAIPGIPAIPAMPAVPAETAAPGWGLVGRGSFSNWGEGPAAGCSDLHYRAGGSGATLHAQNAPLTHTPAPT